MRRVVFTIFLISSSLSFANSEKEEANADKKFMCKTPHGFCKMSDQYSEGAFNCEGVVKIKANYKNPDHAFQIARGRLWNVILKHCKSMDTEPTLIGGSLKKIKSGNSKLKNSKQRYVFRGAFYCSGI
jgi:hypothetical protein